MLLNTSSEGVAFDTLISDQAGKTYRSDPIAFCIVYLSSLHRDEETIYNIPIPPGLCNKKDYYDLVVITFCDPHESSADRISLHFSLCFFPLLLEGCCI